MLYNMMRRYIVNMVLADNITAQQYTINNIIQILHTYGTLFFIKNNVTFDKTLMMFWITVFRIRQHNKILLQASG